MKKIKILPFILLPFVTLMVPSLLSCSWKSISINNDFIVKSPYTWLKSNSNDSISSSPGGAYIKVSFSKSESFGIKCSSSSLFSDHIKIDCYLNDAYHLHPISMAASQTVNGNLMFDNNLNPSYNYLAEVYVSRIHTKVIGDDRWNWENAFSVSSIVLSPNATIHDARQSNTKKTIFYGDSITEAVEVGAQYQCLSLLNQHYEYEYGQIGWGYERWSSEAYYQQNGIHCPQFYWHEGLGNRPLTDTGWDHYANGISRLNSQNKFIDGDPDFIFNNMGVNDTWTFPGQDDKELVCNLYESWLNTITVTAPNADIYIIMPYLFSRGASELEWKNSFNDMYLSAKQSNPNLNKHLFMIDLEAAGDSIVKNHSIRDDKLHPDKIGYEELENLLVECLTAKAPLIQDVNISDYDPASKTISINGLNCVTEENISIINTSYICKYIIDNGSSQTLTIYGNQPSFDIDLSSLPSGPHTLNVESINFTNSFTGSSEEINGFPIKSFTIT